MVVYKSEKQKHKIIDITNSLVCSMNLQGIDHLIDTTFGESYCYEIPKPNKPKLIMMHGGQSNHALTLYVFEYLINNYHIYALDLPGHAGKSAENRINPKSDDYGKWAIEVLEKLGIESAHFLGLSYGGFVCQRLAALRPKFFKSLSLVVPAGIVPMNFKTIMSSLLFPQLGYLITKNEYFFSLMVKALFTDYDNKYVVEFFREVLVGVKPDTRQPKLSTIEEFKGFNAPVFLVTCENDILFNESQQQEQASKIFENLKTISLKDQKHSPSITDENRMKLCNQISLFID